MTSNREFIAAYHARRTAATHHNPPFTPMSSKSTLAAPAETTVAVAQFEQHAKEYRDARDVLAARVDAFHDEVRAIYRRRFGGIKSALVVASDAKAKLSAAVEQNQALFVKPRTMTLHGITFGLKKGSGRMTWDAEDDVLVARIEKMFADDKAARDLLILTRKEPSKDALKELDAKVLAKLGVEVEGVSDVVVIKATDSEVDKLLKRILKEGAGEEIAEPQS